MSDPAWGLVSGLSLAPALDVVSALASATIVAFVLIDVVDDLQELDTATTWGLSPAFAFVGPFP